MTDNNILPIIISFFHIEQTTNPSLNIQSSNNLFIYIQEFIKHKIINKNLTLTKNDMLICETLFFKLGMNNDNIHNAYSFIIDTFNIQKVETNDDKISIINLNTNAHKYNTNIKKMLLKYLCDENINIINSPQYIFINIIRNNKIQIDIQKKIRLNTNHNWFFYSALCKKDDEYYVLLSKDGLWFVYNPNCDNSLYEVKMNDTQLCNNIKDECIFLIYKLT
jgi:hypothetical protein